jgi:hypothetical protein
LMPREPLDEIEHLRRNLRREPHPWILARKTRRPLDSSVTGLAKVTRVCPCNKLLLAPFGRRSRGARSQPIQHLGEILVAST